MMDDDRKTFMKQLVACIQRILNELNTGFYQFYSLSDIRSMLPHIK